MSNNGKKLVKQYSPEYKIEAVKLVKEIGNTKAARELGVPESTLSGWVKLTKLGGIDIGTQTPESAMSLAAEIQRLNAELKAISKANALLRKENAFLEEASAFFAASRQRLVKVKE